MNVARCVERKDVRGKVMWCPKGRLDECPRLLAGLMIDCPACWPGKGGNRLSAG